MLIMNRFVRRKGESNELAFLSPDVDNMFYVSQTCVKKRGLVLRVARSSISSCVSHTAHQRDMFRVVLTKSNSTRNTT